MNGTARFHDAAITAWGFIHGGNVTIRQAIRVMADGLKISRPYALRLLRRNFWRYQNSIR